VHSETANDAVPVSTIRTGTGETWAANRAEFTVPDTDEPMWTEAPEQSEWAARVLREELVEPLRGRARVALHVCGGNPRRKRVYFTKYTDLAPAFRRAKIHEVSLEHCTLSYNLMDLWRLWPFCRTARRMRGGSARRAGGQRSHRPEHWTFGPGGAGDCRRLVEGVWRSAAGRRHVRCS